MKKTAIILYGDFGDVCCITALSNYLKKIGKQYVLITREMYVELAEMYGSFLQVIPFDKEEPQETVRLINALGIETVIDLHNSSYCSQDFVSWLQGLKSQQVMLSKKRMVFIDSGENIKILPDRIISGSTHNSVNYLQRIGEYIDCLPLDSLRISPTKTDKEKASNRRYYLGDKKVIGLVTNSRFEHKQMAFEEWEKVIRAFQSNESICFVLLCATFEMPRVKHFLEYSSVQIWDVEKVHSYVSRILATDIIVSLDTGIKHLAAYVGHPVIGLYGHSDPNIWGTRCSNETVLRGTVECMPCNNPFRCDLGKAICVDSIGSVNIIGEINNHLNKIQ